MPWLNPRLARSPAHRRRATRHAQLRSVTARKRLARPVARAGRGRGAAGSAGRAPQRRRRKQVGVEDRRFGKRGLHGFFVSLCSAAMAVTPRGVTTCPARLQYHAHEHPHTAAASACGNSAELPRVRPRPGQRRGRIRRSGRQRPAQVAMPGVVEHPWVPPAHHARQHVGIIGRSPAQGTAWRVLIPGEMRRGTKSTSGAIRSARMSLVVAVELRRASDAKAVGPSRLVTILALSSSRLTQGAASWSAASGRLTVIE